MVYTNIPVSVLCQGSGSLPPVRVRLAPLLPLALRSHHGEGLSIYEDGRGLLPSRGAWMLLLLMLWCTGLMIR